MHHPKEEMYLFAPLAKRSHAAGDDLHILQQEHENGARLIRDPPLHHRILHPGVGRVGFPETGRHGGAIACDPLICDSPTFPKLDFRETAEALFDLDQMSEK